MSKKAALGKGLGALISSPVISSEPEKINEQDNNSPENYSSINTIPLDRIRVNPYQPRTNFDQQALEELSESILMLGLIQPITVRKIGDEYQIISGERRFRAASKAGLTELPAYIIETEDQGMIEMAIVENIQRENLDPIEIAVSFQRLIEECNLTQEAMSARIGKNRSSVTNYLRLLRLPAQVQYALKTKAISMGHAKVILTITEIEQQINLCDQIQKKGLSVRQAESKVHSILAPNKDKQEVELPDTYNRLIEIMETYSKNNISFKRSENGKAKMTISFNNDKEVENLLDILENLRK